ncbi:MAG TPA: helix-turn-helix domain-containing protein, partial [Microbacterium sp.]|uniref:TetR/AcrR family transcriptional regulator n=1 Tax=Microbacterium sp. TaxID=51671 RepID=UPI002B45D3E5
MSEPDQPTRRPGRPREIYRRAPGVGAPIGTRSDEVQATTRAILEAGQRLVVERGARAVTIAAVAAEAHVDVSTVTYHFGSRAGLFEAIRDHQYRDDLAEVVAEALRRDDPPARLDAYFAGVRRMLDDSMATR